KAKAAKIVTPRIDAEYTVLLVPHRLLAYEQLPTTAHPTSGTRIEVYLDQDQPGIPYKGGATLSFPPAQVEVFEDEDCRRADANFDGTSLIIDKGLLADGRRLTRYLRARSAGPITATLAADPTSKLGALAQRRIVVAAAAQLRMAGVQLDLELYE